MDTKRFEFYKKKSGIIPENEVKDLLQNFNIKTTKYKVVDNVDNLYGLDFDFPMVLKICSTKILHKTEINGVKLNIKNMDELKKEFNNFKSRFPYDNIMVEQMVNRGLELIIGLFRDPTFGLCIMYGIGGIFTELYKDVNFRIVPINNYDAYEMIDEIKGKKILEGFRNIKTNKKKVIDLILKVSRIGEKFSNYINEMDLNPVFVYENDICVVDAKLVFK